MSTDAPSPDSSPTRAPDASPPKVRLAFRVGVTGHRPDAAKRPTPNVARLRATVRAILGHISDAVHGVARTSDAYLGTGPASEPSESCSLRLVSALAEGPDQWVADEALSLGYELHCALPFARDEYERDLKDANAGNDFRRLLDAATAVLELDGALPDAKAPDPLSAGAAYEAVGRAVLNQSDLLVAVWDGKPSQGRGGTGSVVAESLKRGIPVVWVTWADPDRWVLRLPEWRLVEQPADIEGDAERLKRHVQELVLPPDEADATNHHAPTTTRDEYFSEGPPRGNALHGWWRVFLLLVTGDLFRAPTLRQVLAGDPFKVPDIIRSTSHDWEHESRHTVLDASWPHPDAPLLAGAVEAAYLHHYAWANRLSLYYGNMYRSAFVVAYLLAAVAVFFALVASAAGLSHERGRYLIACELVAILVILGLTWYGRRRRWHERWVDYRMLAERLRLARCLAIFGGGGQDVPLPAHLATYGSPTATWMHWHYRAIERAAGVSSIRFTPSYLEASRDFWVTHLIERQIDYHQGTHRWHARLDHRLHVAGNTLFAATLIACVLHLSTGAEVAGRWLTLLAAVLPALAAGLAALRTHAEAQRLARRSEGMRRELLRLKLEVASMPVGANQGHSQRLRAGVDKVTDLMERELVDWRVVFLDRPLETQI